MAYERCIARLKAAAGRELTDEEVSSIFERIHKAALDIKAGRVDPAEVGLGKPLEKKLGVASSDSLIQEAAQRAAADLAQEAAITKRNAYLQVVKLGARMNDVERMTDAGMAPLDALEKTIVRDYSGRTNVESLEQRVTGYKSYFGGKLIDTWQSLGNDFLGYLQDRTKLLTLVRELRGEDTGDAVAGKGAKAFHDAAEEARQAFNAAGGDIGRLDDWGMPQHHSQFKVASAGKEEWTNTIMPMLDRARYVDDIGVRWSDTELRAFLGKAWDTIATDGIANMAPGEFTGSGKRANRHAESRQIHFKDAQSVIDYWNAFGERTAVEILAGHMDTLARDIAFIEYFGPNPNITYATLRDRALQEAAGADPVRTEEFRGQAAKLDALYEYSAGNIKPTADLTIAKVADGIHNLNTAGKLGGAAVASFFGDKPIMEAVSHLNDLPVLQRWRTELAMLNPANGADRDLLRRQGLMLESVRSGLLRFNDTLGTSSVTGKIANAVMRMTGMNAINDLRKAAFGLSLMDAIGTEIRRGVGFDELPNSDVRTLRNYGITDAEWNVWKLARLDNLGRGNDAVLTPEAISRIPDDALRAANIIGAADDAAAAGAARRNAIVKLLGAVNTESEFAIVTPGWKERATFYANLQRGTATGEIVRAVLQFKSFPWTMFQRSMDLIANSDTPAGKAVMTSYLIASTTLAGAMLMETRDMLSGKDPRATADRDWYKFWSAAFVQGGALGIYSDFLYGAAQTRYGSGITEVLAGPTVGPLLELGVVRPLTAAKAYAEGKETHFAARTLQDLKGFMPGGNVWYTKAAMDHLVWQRVMESLSPGYLASIRSQTMKDYNQAWWWRPGETAPERAPDFAKALPR